jgi:ATP-dependent DNA helicase RecG
MVRQIVNVMNDPNLRPYSKNPIIANFFHQIGRADELGSGVRNLYHYVKLYSGADPIFDERDIFRLTVPLNADYSPEKGLATTPKTTLKTTPKTILKATRKTTTRKATTRKVTTRKIVEEQLRELIGQSPTLSLPELASELEMTADGVYYHVNVLKKAGKLRRIGGRKSGHWEFIDSPKKEA